MLLLLAFVLIIIPFVTVQLERHKYSISSRVHTWMQQTGLDGGNDTSMSQEPNQNPLRKPWNPPFPTQPPENEPKKGILLSLPKLHLPASLNNLVRHDSDDLPALEGSDNGPPYNGALSPGTAAILGTYRRLPPPPLPTPIDPPSSHDPLSPHDVTIKPIGRSRTEPMAQTLSPPIPRRTSERSLSATSAAWITLQLMSVALIVFLILVLIAHCMAWFVVYKTESRLGDVRRGLLRGGEMRMCLCTR
ncbi:hypothetical protein BU24DRAFT_479648 [Aaosphaeria arxii CBS 175.79]|uniref:Uncharacterized protein n=1 Tax=Aaosphaeria arxii CBS 175.79 TaxID=1450172 RepID=A0A6A5XZK5_9PLEO|nr:uncharacterized protein BU24DRAFT_479648 [Aaosphaeria arxii CBS 175.79]KAF2018247.1 hypothetical protein BU24DRAFT_479648 [Aaosphaeria arxii CBS 175.79]